MKQALETKDPVTALWEFVVLDPARPAESRDDIRYIHSTFLIVERTEMAAYGAYRSRDLCLAWINALMAGQPDSRLTL